MDPVFKIRWSDGVEPDPPRGAAVAVIEMGNRKIVLRAATGEQGEKGPFPFVELQEKGKDPVSGEPYHFSGGFCMTRESEFEDLWKFLEAGCR